MFYLEISAVLVQLVAVWLLTLLKLLASIRIQHKVTIIVEQYEKAKEADQKAPRIPEKKVGIPLFATSNHWLSLCEKLIRGVLMDYNSLIYWHCSLID